MAQHQMCSFLFSICICFCDEWTRKHKLKNISNIFTRLVRIVTSYCFICPTNVCCKCFFFFFLSTNEDKPTHDVVLLVDEAPLIGCVIDCNSLSLLHEVLVVLVLVMKYVFGSLTLFTNFTCFCPKNIYCLYLVVCEMLCGSLFDCLSLFFCQLY